MSITLRDLAWTNKNVRKQDALAYDGLDPLLQLTIRLFKENKALKEMYTPKWDYIQLPLIGHCDTKDIDIEKMSDGT